MEKRCFDTWKNIWLDSASNIIAFHQISRAINKELVLIMDVLIIFNIFHTYHTFNFSVRVYGTGLRGCQTISEKCTK